MERGPLARRYAGADAGNSAEDERRAIKVLLCPGEDLQGETFDEVAEVITPMDAPDFHDIRVDNLPLWWLLVDLDLLTDLFPLADFLLDVLLQLRRTRGAGAHIGSFELLDHVRHA